MIYEKFEEIPFQNRARGRLRQIYAVIYYMQKGYNHTEAIKRASNDFSSVKDNYATVHSKCTTQLDINLSKFVELVGSGGILSKLVQKNNLNEEDKKIFAELLDTSSEKKKDTLKPENEIDVSISEEKREVLYLWKRVLKNQSSGVEFNTKERHHQHQKMIRDAKSFVNSPSQEGFIKFWEVMDSAQRKANAKNVWEKNSQDTLVEVISDMIKSSEFKQEWVKRINSARRTLWELFGIFHVKKTPTLNSCSERGLKFFGFEVRDKYEDVLSNFKKFRDEIYLSEIGHVTKGLNYEVPINLEVDQLFNVVDKTKEKSVEKGKTEEEKELYETVLKLKGISDKNTKIEEGKKQYWRIWAGESGELWSEWSKNDYVAIGWNDINPEEGGIGNQVEEKYPDDDPNYVKRTFEYFLDINEGDIIIVCKKKGEAVAKVTSDYYSDNEATNYKHKRDVVWHTRDIDSGKFGDDFKNKVRHRYTFGPITEKEYIETIENILALEEPEREEKKRWEKVKSDLEYYLDIDFEIDSEQLFFPDNMRKNMETQITSSLKIGKHIILIGPPGTGKSKLAKQICERYPEKYIMSTATSDWSTFDTIGGYRPEKDGGLQFKPGIFLKCFKDTSSFEPDNKWLIIDEINRADIDKAFGSLFSALTGDDITLPFENDKGPIKVIGEPKDEMEIKRNTYIIHPDWRIIATMNTFDKTSLYEMSYAFMRRFAFIPVDIPPETEINKDLIEKYLLVWGGDPEENKEIVEKLPRIWKTINETRKIGPAIIEDIYRYVKNESGDFASPIVMYVLPQFEGLLEDKIIAFVESLDIEDKMRVKQFCSDFFDIDLEKFEKRSEG